MHLVVTKFAYLKTPSYSVTLHNDQGGSSSSISGCKSLKAVASQVWFKYGRDRVVAPATPVFLEVWESFDDNDEPLITRSESTVDALLARIAGAQ